MNSKNSRIEYLDNLRVFAALAVVLLHTASITYTTFSPDLSPFWSQLSNNLWVLTRFCVPVFVMITGYLLLQPTKEIPYQQIIGRYIRRIVSLLFTIGLCYAWLEIVFTEKAIGLHQFPTVISNVLTGKLWDHMWYLYMLIGLYLVIPIIKAFVRISSQRQVDALMAILTIFCVLLPEVKLFYGWSLGIPFPISGVYVLYLLLGYRLGNTHIRSRYLLCSLLLTAGFILLLMYLNRQDSNYSSTHFVYESPAIFLLSGSLFLLFRNLSNELNHRLYTVSSCVAQYTLGIYLFHPFYLNIMGKVLHFNPMTWGLYSLIAVVLTTFSLSWLTTWLYSKLPVIGKDIL